MEMSAEKSAGIGEIDPQVWRAFFAGVHPVKMAASISALTQIPERTIGNWLAGTSRPSMAAFCKLAFVYGPEFFLLAMPGVPWVAAAACRNSALALDAEIARLKSKRQALLDEK